MVRPHDEDGGTMIIPGHGRVTDEWEVAEYRDMLVIIRDRVQAMIKAGATAVLSKVAGIAQLCDEIILSVRSPRATVC